MGTDLKKYIWRKIGSVNRAACNRPKRSASDVRDRFADYFVSREGALPWQWTKFNIKLLIVSIQ